MFRGIRRALLGLGLLLATVPASRADMMLQFTQVGSTMQNPYSGSGEPFPIAMIGEMFLVVTDEAYAAGLNLSQRNGGSGIPYAFLDGVVALHVALLNIWDGFSASLADFTRDIPIGASGASMIQITSAPGGLPVGSIYYNSPLDMSVRFNFNGSQNVTAFAIGDSSCFVGCNFGGTLAVAVPEPASVLTFGIGLLVLSAARARRHAAGACGRRAA